MTKKVKKPTQQAIDFPVKVERDNTNPRNMGITAAAAMANDKMSFFVKWAELPVAVQESRWTVMRLAIEEYERVLKREGG